MSGDHGQPAATVFANAMWRSGSTYLASCFAKSPRYLLFYEPDHEYVGSLRAIRRARGEQMGKLAALRHPDIGGGYFDVYEQCIPGSKRPLARYFPASAALRDVYDRADPRYMDFLKRCERLASANGKTAFFGFCRSGTQHATVDGELPGVRLHLWRSPRGQFESYDWPRNDYFVPGTLLQLLLSGQFSKMVPACTDGRINKVDRLLLRGIRHAPAALLYRVGRRLAGRLSPSQAYRLFYLSWLASYESGRATATLSFSLTGLTTDPALRKTLEKRFAVDLSAVRATRDEGVEGVIDHGREEQAVERLFAAERTGRNLAT